MPTDTLQRLADDVAALTMPSTTHVEYVRTPGTGADGIRRRSPEPGTWRARQPALLLALFEALPPSNTMRGDDGTHAKPRSRPPVNPAASAAVDRILNGWVNGLDYTPGIWDLRRYLRRASGYITPEVPRTSHGVVGALHDVRALAHSLGGEHADEAARVIAAYVSCARTALAYEAPMVTLRDHPCRYCRGPLQVRADASGPVRCATSGCVDEAGRRPEWPQEVWHLLLVEDVADTAA